MLVIMYGAMGCGKTTALNAFMEDLDTDVDVAAVFADSGYTLRWVGDELVQESCRGWKGKLEDKLANARRCIADRSCVWVMESGRPDMTPSIQELYAEAGGGLEFIYVMTTGRTMKRFLQARCAAKSKVYNDDYWTTSKLQYEGLFRCAGQVINYLIPSGIPYHVFMVDENRLAWDYIMDRLYDIVTQSYEWWWPE